MIRVVVFLANLLALAFGMAIAITAALYAFLSRTDFATETTP